MGDLLLSLVPLLDTNYPPDVGAAQNEGEARYRLLLEGLNVVPWEYDWREGRFTYIAGKAEDLFGWPLADWLSPGFWAKTIHPDDRDDAVGFCVAASNKGEDHDFEYRLMTADGGFRWVHDIVRVFPRPNGNPILRGVFVDVSPRHRAEEERQKTMVDLAMARDRAEKAVKENEMFLSLVAHDLKSPLTGIEGFLALLQSKHPEIMEDHSFGQMTDALAASVKRANEMIVDTLRLNRFRSGVITVRTRFINASYAALAATAGYGHLAKEGGVALTHTVPADARIYADHTLLGEVLANLVTNALKFTPAGGRVTVEWDERGGFAVVDTGLGVKPELLDYLFDIDHPTSQRGLHGERGTGLGLPFCREIAQAHGGELIVESTLGHGSRFTLLLPTVVPRALVVDDEEGFRYLVAQPLRRRGITVVEAVSGQAALDLIEEDPPHLVITDLNMPGIDGFELLSRIKGSPKSRDIPTIVVTSDASIETRERAIRLGADDFLTKPVQAEELLPRVSRFTA